MNLNNIRNALAVTSFTVLVMFGGTACTPACDGLSASERDRQAAQDGYEVEREDSRGNTCELSQDGKTWDVDD